MEKWPETYWKRPIPTAHWLGVSLMTALIVLGFLITWETYWRLQGYEPSFEEVAELWAVQRDRVNKNDPGEVVLIGSSRVAFDIDLDVWQQDAGRRPVMLSLVGNSPRPFLRELAADKEFTGTVICGVTPELFFGPDNTLLDQDARKYLDHRKHRSLSARSDFLLSVPLQSAFASLNKEDLSLDALLKNYMQLKDREGAYVLPRFPPYFASLTFDRRNHMWSRMEFEKEVQHEVQQIWLPLFNIAPPFEGEGLTALINSVKEDVAKIQSRGGKVLFLRCPSTEELRAIENRKQPREKYWDRLLVETGAPGIHFEDYPELSHFDCPEWSHLTRSDAVTFTRNLLPLIQEKLCSK